MKMVTKAAIVIGALAAALSSVPASAQDGRLSLSFTPASPRPRAIPTSRWPAPWITASASTCRLKAT